MSHNIIECYHSWCYSPYALSCPIRQNRICTICGKQEMVVLENYSNWDEYDSTIEKFRNDKE